MKPDEKAPEVSAQDALRIIEQERVARAGECRERVQRALQELRCRIDIITIIRTGQPTQQMIDFIAEP